MGTRSIKVKDLRVATEASIRAALAKTPIKRPGILTGFLLDKASIARLDVSPGRLAKDIASSTGKLSGLRLRPVARRVPGGILVGFMPPKIMKR